MTEEAETFMLEPPGIPAFFVRKLPSLLQSLFSPCLIPVMPIGKGGKKQHLRTGGTGLKAKLGTAAERGREMRLVSHSHGCQ